MGQVYKYKVIISLLSRLLTHAGLESGSTHLQTSILSQDYNASEEQTENANWYQPDMDSSSKCWCKRRKRCQQAAA